MNYFKKDELGTSLKKHTPVLELKTGAEGTVTVSEYGGRVLGLFPKKDCINLLWIHPEIGTILKKRQWNIGGDRYWISPEKLFFYKDPENFKDWFCPVGLDPAHYEFTSWSDKHCLLNSPISLTNQASQKRYEGLINRYISIVSEPVNTGVPYCGVQYIEDCTLEVPALQINGWSLAQVISGGPENPGTVLIPTNPNPKPLSYFRTIPENRLKIKENYITYKIDVSDIYKLAIRPEDIDFSRPAKIGYVLKLPGSEDFGFLVKLSSDLPKSQSECFDIARDHPDGEIGVIQSYNSESTPPSLMCGEIELQLTPFKSVYDTSQETAKHQIFGYIGTKEQILNVIEKYLGIDSPELF